MADLLSDDDIFGAAPALLSDDDIFGAPEPYSAPTAPAKGEGMGKDTFAPV